jgi:transcriptional regulator with XRE-family HTH domain
MNRGMTTDRPTGGSRLASARHLRRLRQYDAARQIGVHPETLSRWERGATTPELDGMRRIAAWVGVPLVSVLGWWEPEPDEVEPLTPPGALDHRGRP